MQRFLKVPVDGYDDVLTILKLENYLGLYRCFDYEGRKALSLYLLQAVLDKEAHVTSLEQVGQTGIVMHGSVTDKIMRLPDWHSHV